MREIVAGDTYSGLSRTAEGYSIATGIALPGAAVGLGIGYIHQQRDLAPLDI